MFCHATFELYPAGRVPLSPRCGARRREPAQQTPAAAAAGRARWPPRSLGGDATWCSWPAGCSAARNWRSRARPKAGCCAAPSSSARRSAPRQARRSALRRAVAAAVARARRAASRARRSPSRRTFADGKAVNALTEGGKRDREGRRRLRRPGRAAQRVLRQLRGAGGAAERRRRRAPSSRPTSRRRPKSPCGSTDVTTERSRPRGGPSTARRYTLAMKNPGGDVSR